VWYCVLENASGLCSFPELIKASAQVKIGQHHLHVTKLHFTAILYLAFLRWLAGVSHLTSLVLLYRQLPKLNAPE